MISSQGYAAGPPSELTVDVPHAHLVGDVVGTGPVLVQLHGLTSSRARDELLELNLAEDVPGRRLVRFDARGHGRSTGRAQPEDYTWPVLANDLLRVMDEVAPDEPVDAIGQSMGAGTLLHAVALAPERFRTLTLVIPPTAWETRTAQAAAYLAGAKLAEEQGFEAFVRAGAAVPRPPAAPPAPHTRPHVSPALLPSILRGAALSDLPDHAILRSVEVPTLILAWEADPSHPLATSQALHRDVAHSELTIARSPEDSLTWGSQAARHVAEHAG